MRRSRRFGPADQLRKRPGAELLHTVRGLGHYAGPEEGGG
jgi:hypothetical protein